MLLLDGKGPKEEHDSRDRFFDRTADSFVALCMSVHEELKDKALTARIEF